MSERVRSGFTLGLEWRLVPRECKGNDIPCPDMGIEGSEIVNTDVLREYADSQRVHLYTIADVIDKMETKGWRTCGRLYRVLCSKVCTEDEAVADLEELGLSAYSPYLEEWELEKFKEE